MSALRALRPARVYPATVRGRVGRNGEVVVPSALLRAVGLRPGDAVRLSRYGNAVLVEQAAPADALMGRLSGHRLVEALEIDRRAERQR